MLLIFGASTDAGSSTHSSRIIGPLLRFFKPDVSPETIDRVQTVVRKGGHLTEYAILAFLLWRARRKPARRDRRPWNWNEAWFAVAGVALYAMSDEFHQSFVPSREASVRDVLIDTAGGLAGVAVIWLVGRWRKRW